MLNFVRLKSPGYNAGCKEMTNLLFKKINLKII